jgi:hypothetical protein
VISFATLLLGLVLGVQSIDLVVADSVTAVDVILDGEVVETLKGPPWRARVDFGSELEPHLLEVVALDRLYGELGRASQRVNLPRDPVEIEIVAEEGEGGRGSVAHVTWESLIGGDPSSTLITLDGQPLEPDDPSRVELPPYDPELLHLLRVELEFGGSAFSAAELVFGGSWVGSASMALTATAIELEGKTRVKSAEDLRGVFVSGEETLEVAVVEKDASEVVVVRTPAASELLAQMAPSRVAVTLTGDPSAASQLQASARRDWRAQFIWPVPRLGGEEGQRFDLFPHSQHFTEEDTDLANLIVGVRPPVLGGKVRLADAVAIAGVTAAASNRRRTVILVLAGAAADASEASPAVARRFLEHLRVPLEVWSVAEDGAVAEGWGEAVDVSSRSKLDKALRRTFRALDSQRVVWLKGLHLPSGIQLSREAAGLRLAGTAGGPE